MARLDERCEHPGCEYGQRLEYCVPNAGRFDEAELTRIKLDDLLNVTERAASDRYSASVTSEECVVERQYSYLYGNFKTWVWPLIEKSVSLQLTTTSRPSHERYDIAVSWIVHQAGVMPNAVRSLYTLDAYQNGSLHMHVQTPEVISGKYDSRPATAYDFSELYTELDRVSGAQASSLL